MQNIFRHGDVLLKRIDKMPKGRTIKTDGKYILTYSEVTGHKHVMTTTRPEHLKILDKDGGIFIELNEPATITHEEHNTITIEPGYFKVIIEREYDPYLESARTVLD